MGFRTVLLGTLGLLAMLSTSAHGQLPMNQPLFNTFPSPINNPGSSNPNTPQQYTPPATNPGGFNRQNSQSPFPQNNPPRMPNQYSPSSNIPQNFPAIVPSPVNPQNPSPNIKPLNPIGRLLEDLIHDLAAIHPPKSSPVPHNTQPNTPQSFPPIRHPEGSMPYRGQPGSPQQNPYSNHPSGVNPNGFYPPRIQPNRPQNTALRIPPSAIQPNRPQNYLPRIPPGRQNPIGAPNGPPLYTPHIYPPNTQHGFNSYIPPSQQHVSIENHPGRFISYENHPSNPHYQTSGGYHPGGFSTYNSNPNIHTNPTSNRYLPSSSSNSNTHQNPTPSYPSNTGSSSIPYPTKSPPVSITPSSTQITSSSSSGGGNTTSIKHVSSHSHSGYHKSHSHAHGSSHPLADDNSLGDYRIVCLFNNRHYFRGGFTPSEIDPSLCTHINYEFAILDPKSHEMMIGEPDLDVGENFYQKTIDLRKVNPKLKVLLSLGGWSDSTKKYSEMAADKDKRENFVEKAVQFLKQHEFDGMDLAWEYPNCWQGAIHVNPSDKDNFVSLLKEMKPALGKEGMILSVSVGAIKREVEAAYDVPSISNTVDYMNIMTYDMHGPWESVTGHHMQFEKMPDDDDPYCNVKAAMEFWVEKGADKKKMNMGMAMYAKTFTLQDPNNCGMHAPAVGVGDPGPNSDEGGLLLYNEICPWLNAGNWTEEEDKYAGSYAYCGDQWACYDSPMMAVKKAKYVIDHGYGGVLMKDLSGDDYKGVCFNMPFPFLKMVKFEMVQRYRWYLHHG